MIVKKLSNPGPTHADTMKQKEDLCIVLMLLEKLNH